MTTSPSGTLLGYTRIPSTLTPILRVLRTPSVVATVTRLATVGTTPVSQPSPQPLTLDPPTCYETPVGSLWCLGLVRNRLSSPVDSVLVRVYLVNQAGTALVQQDSIIPRQVLLPDEAAPYGVLFATAPEGFAGPVALLLTANSAKQTEQRTLVLTIEQPNGLWRDKVYHLNGQVRNATKTRARSISIVATIFDAAGRVLGFRQLRLEGSLDSGAALVFELDIIPLLPMVAHYELTAEAQPD